MAANAYGLLKPLPPLLLALGYGAGILILMRHPLARADLSSFGLVGRMAFTNYVLQSLIFGFIFFGYGFGQFGQLGAVFTLFIGAVVFACQMGISRWWLLRYRFGPIEWLWRSFMYGVAQPMKV